MDLFGELVEQAVFTLAYPVEIQVALELAFRSAAYRCDDARVV